VPEILPLYQNHGVTCQSDAPRLWIFTDGACSKNPGPGGWGILARHLDSSWEFSGGEKNTTNNRMEMMGVIRALEWIQAQGFTCPITITSDSQYVIKGITQWISGWMRNGWKTAAKKPVENQDLWQQMWHLATGKNLDWQWVRGHNGHQENERVDELARAAVIPFLK